ncbi:MAG TPA: hypothetical protein VD814_09970 [Nocardioides sp.]|nr:hypothetical protein [Nocardioides sp.]
MTQGWNGHVSPEGASWGPDGPAPARAARHEASEVAETARDAGDHVTRTAADQARHVAAEGQRQARDVLREGRDQVVEQARSGQRLAAQRIGAFGDELVEMAGKTKGSGPGSELARQGAERAHAVSAWLEQREPTDVLDEVRRFARRRPGTFLLGAALAGVVAGRLTSGVLRETRGGRGQDHHDAPTPPPTPAPAPAPAPAPTEAVAPPDRGATRPAAPAEVPPPVGGPAPEYAAPPVDVPPEAPYDGWGPPPPGGFEPYPDQHDRGAPVPPEGREAPSPWDRVQP